MLLRSGSMDRVAVRFAKRGSNIALAYLIFDIFAQCGDPRPHPTAMVDPYIVNPFSVWLRRPFGSLYTSDQMKAVHDHLRNTAGESPQRRPVTARVTTMQNTGTTERGQDHVSFRKRPLRSAHVRWRPEEQGSLARVAYLCSPTRFPPGLPPWPVAPQNTRIQF